MLEQEHGRAARARQDNRATIFDALWLGRMVVNTLTLATLVSLLMLFMQLKRQERERRQVREQLAAHVQRRSDQLTNLARYFQSEREAERSRIARQLHDELGALLTVSKLEISRARNRAVNDAEILKSLDRVAVVLNKGIALKRRIIEDLTPSSLTQLGLTVALEILCNDMTVNLAVPVHTSLMPLHLSPDSELAVYRFVQEALTNVGKHAAATAVTVTLTAGAGHASVEVQDNGVGFDLAGSRIGGYGLAGMRFWAESLGGFMSVRSSPGHGTTLRIEIPQLRGGPPPPEFVGPVVGQVAYPLAI